MTETQILLREIEQFLVEHNLPATRFGRLACNDLHTVRRLRQGLGVTMRRVERLREFMRKYKDRSSGPKRRTVRRPAQRAAA